VEVSGSAPQYQWFKAGAHSRGDRRHLQPGGGQEADAGLTRWSSVTTAVRHQQERRVNREPAPNTAPVLDPIADQPVNELTPLTFTATATDAEAPPQRCASAWRRAGGGWHWDQQRRVHLDADRSPRPGDYLLNVLVSDNGTRR